jgi:hypothetical protein
MGPGVNLVMGRGDQNQRRMEDTVAQTVIKAQASVNDMMEQGLHEYVVKARHV